MSKKGGMPTEAELEAMLEAAAQEDEERRRYYAQHGMGNGLPGATPPTRRQLHRMACRGLSLVPDNPPG